MDRTCARRRRANRSSAAAGAKVHREGDCRRKSASRGRLWNPLDGILRREEPSRPGFAPGPNLLDGILRREESSRRHFAPGGRPEEPSRRHFAPARSSPAVDRPRTTAQALGDKHPGATADAGRQAQTLGDVRPSEGSGVSPEHALELAFGQPRPPHLA